MEGVATTNKTKRAKAGKVPAKVPMIQWTMRAAILPPIKGWRYLMPAEIAKSGDFCWKVGNHEWEPVSGINGCVVRDDGFVATDYIVIRRQPKRGGGK